MRKIKTLPGSTSSGKPQGMAAQVVLKESEGELFPIVESDGLPNVDPRCLQIPPSQMKLSLSLSLSMKFHDKQKETLR